MPSGITGLLNIGSAALQAQQAGIATTGKNTANVNTDGYQRESVDLSSLVGTNGVLVGNAYRADDPILALRERVSAGAQGRTQTLSTALTGLEQNLTASGANLVQAIASLFGGLLDLASAPADGALRTAALQKAQNVGSTFQTASAAISQSQSDSDARILSYAQQATDLAKQIAAANHALATQKDPTLLDRRDKAATQLAAITGGQARIDPDGKMRFVVAGGQVLVDGDHSMKIVAAPDAAYGNHLKISVVDGTHTADVTTVLDGGKFAGEIAFRDGTSAAAAKDLDQLAYDLSTQLNAVHKLNAGLDGKTGRNLYTPPVAVAGAAAKLAVDPTVFGDPRLLAAAAPGAGSSDNTGVNALIALRDQKLAGAGTATFIDQSINTLAAVGSATQTAKSDLDLQQAKADVLAATRNSVSGVSTNEELARLATFQKAAQAAGNFVSSVNTMMDYLISKL